MSFYRRLLQLIMRIELVLGGLFVLFVVVVICLQVFMRYVVGEPLIWVQESVMLAFIWITMLGASAALKMNVHVKIETFLSFLPQPLSKVITLVVSLIILSSLLLLALKLPGVIGLQNRSRTSSMPINIPRGYYYSLPVLVSVLMMILTQIYYLIGTVLGMLGRQPLPVLAAPEVGRLDGDVGRQV